MTTTTRANLLSIAKAFGFAIGAAIIIVFAAAVGSSILGS